LDEAITAYGKATEIDPGIATNYGGLGNALLQAQGKLDGAVAAFRKTIELDPNNALAFSELGRALRAQGKLDEAAATYRKAIKLDPKLDSAYLGLGEALMAKKQFVEAEAILRELVRFKPTVDAHAYLGSVLVSQRKWKDAQSTFEDALSIKPDYAYAHSSLAWILGDCPEPRFHDFNQALMHAQKALDLQPTRQHLSRLGAIQYRAGKWQQAALTLQKVDKMAGGPDDYHRVYRAMADWNLGNKHEALKHWVQAVQWMDKAVPVMKQNDPLSHEELTNLRAEAEGLLGEFRDPESAYREILRVEPKSAWAHYALADFFYRTRQWAKSAAAYVKAFDLEEPADERKWFKCACSLVQAGDTEGYRKLCDRMLKRLGQSRNVDQIVYLAHACVLAPDALADSGRVLQLAEQRSSLTAELDGHKFWSMHVLGLAYYRAGQFEKAVASLEAGQKHPGLNLEIKLSNWLVLAMCRHRLGQNGEAATALESARAILASEQREFDRESLIVQVLFREAETLLRKQ
jgi:tetratricopeptide (TPR) repeat protein